jgi:MFS family permease
LKINDTDYLQVLKLGIPLTALNFVMSFPAAYLVDKLGRRYMLLRTLPVCAISWLLVAASMSYEFDLYKEEFAILGIGGLAVFISAFSLGVAGAAFLINTEIYPLHVNGSAISIALFVNWMFNFLISTLFPLALSYKFYLDPCTNPN